MSTQASLTPHAIQDRVRRGYLERLEGRVKKMRLLLAEREWNRLRVELIHLKNTAPTFGLPDLGELAAQVLTAFPTGDLSRASSFTKAHEESIKLFSAIERRLTQAPVQFTV